MKTTIGELIEKIDAIESVVQDLHKMDSDTADKAADYLWDYLIMIRSEKVEIRSPRGYTQQRRRSGS